MPPDHPWAATEIPRNAGHPLAVPFDALRFGVGTLALTEPTFGLVSGTLGGPGWSLALAGHYTYGNPNHARFQGSGDIDGERWVYDYVGYLVPA